MRVKNKGLETAPDLVITLVEPRWVRVRLKKSSISSLSVSHKTTTAASDSDSLASTNSRRISKARLPNPKIKVWSASMIELLPFLSSSNFSLKMLVTKANMVEIKVSPRMEVTNPITLL